MSPQDGEVRAEEIEQSAIDREFLMNNGIIELRRQIRRAAFDRAIEICMSEPEFPGPMPEYVREELKKHSLEEQQRGAVGATKESIALRLTRVRDGVLNG